MKLQGQGWVKASYSVVRIHKMRMEYDGSIPNFPPKVRQ